VKFWLNIEPVGQMRARHGSIRTKGGKVISKTYKHDKQEDRELTLAALMTKYVPEVPLSGPLALRVKAVFSIPASWSQKKKIQAANGELWPTKRPDLDNVIKHVKDVMTDLRFWIDDAHVVEYLPGTGKAYGVNPGIEIEILPVEGRKW
jgi:Holliday junction resolvase RusA-like endonuclease